MKTGRFLLLFLGVVISFSHSGHGEASDIPESSYIQGLVGHRQTYMLSCEARSAVDWAAFWGVRIREKKFLNKLPRSDNPDEGFVGDPQGAWGNMPPNSYGVHADPVASLLRRYGLNAEARHNLNWDELRKEIAAGRPVIVWVISHMWPGKPVTYTALNGKTITVASHEHTVILIGYDSSTVQVVDAFTGQTRTYPVYDFLRSWETLGRMAITGTGKLPEPTPTPTEVSNPNPSPTSTAVPQPQVVSMTEEKIFLPVIQQELAKIQQTRKPTSLTRTYTVKPGDYLAAVAKKLGVNWLKLAELNNLPFPFVIHPGQVIKIR